MVRVVTLPNGRQVRLGVYVAAWRTLRDTDPDRLVPDFEWYAVPASEVLRRLRDGMHDRINRHVPGYGRGRKWSSDWYRAALQTARAVNTPRLVVRWVPPDLRARLVHRVTYAMEVA